MTHQQPRKNGNAASGGFSRGPKSSEVFAAIVPNSNRAVHLSAPTRFQVPGRSPDWLKMKNSDAPAVTREAEEDWGQREMTLTGKTNKPLPQPDMFFGGRNCHNDAGASSVRSSTIFGCAR